ncbi:MAG TPA: DUF1992 domain-containing protein [Firmicutes bacterium]|nr:DUF1992 domain-containing protein [Bacillota bacterium]
MRDAIFKIAERKIQEAIENGDLDNLPGAGKPLKLETDFHVPEDLRATYGILRQAGVLPEELDLQQAIAKLEEMLAAAPSAEEAGRLKAKLAEKRLHYDILMEKRRKKPLHIY